MAKCVECGMHYDGWSCPFCNKLEEAQRNIKDLLDEKQEQQEEANQQQIEALAEIATAQADVAAWQVKEQKRAVSEAWRLQSQNKTERADELYQAGLYDEAAKLCEEAINQDPGNIGAYHLAARSHKASGREDSMRMFLEKEVTLSLNRSIPDQSVTVDLLEMGGKELMQYYILESESRGFEHNLVGIICAVAHDEINGNKDAKEILNRIKRFFRQFESHERENLFSVLKDYINRGFISNTVLQKLREPLQDRYKEWEPKINEDNIKLAERLALQDANRGDYTWFMWLSGMVIFGLWMSVWGDLAEEILPTGPLHQLSGILKNLLFLLLRLVFAFIPPIAGAIFIEYLVKIPIRKSLEKRHIARLEENEKRQLTNILKRS